MIPLLKTKLYTPPLRPEVVARPHLLDRLNAGLFSGRKLTLISAPPGFGKSTCVSEWVHALDLPVTWLSLDSADDDPGRFVLYLVAALQKIKPSLGQEIEGVLRSGQLPPVDVISTNLVNDLLELEGRSLLVLDDVQVIQDPFILQALEQLVTHLPPQLHVVLITREDPPLPLARLRANNELTEIRARDLRFTRRDTDHFLNGMMGLSLSTADIVTLKEKTEGWIVGLQLAAIAIQSLPSSRDRADSSEFIATLSGSHRFILSYLTEQVLSRQPEDIQQFLLQTAILDKLTGDLCDAVTGRSDGRTLLRQLFNANLFLVPLDDAGEWYRYHHLFADLLRNLAAALPKEELTERHRRASCWYAQMGGEGSMFVNEAIRHALIAEEYELTVKLLESHAPGMIMQGYAKTVHGWVQAIPAEWSSQSPRTHVAFAWMHLFRGAYTQAFPYLERLQTSLADAQIKQQLGEEGALLDAERFVIQSLIWYAQGKVEESVAAVTRALETAPEPDSHVRGLAYYALASVRQFLEDYPRAIEAYQLAIQHSRVAGNLVAEMMSTIGLALMLFKHGQLHLAFEIAAPAVARFERLGSSPPTSAGVYGLLGQVYYQWGHIEQARDHILRALQLSTLGGYNTITAYYRVLLSRLLEMGGDLEAAAREIQSALELVQVATPAYVRQEAISQQVRVALARNRPDVAEMALQGEGFSFRGTVSFPDIPPGESIPYSMGLLYNSGLRVLLHQARSRRDSTGLRAGITFADQLIEGARRGRYLPILLETLLLRAQIHALLGDRTASRMDTVRALELAEPEDFVALFVEQGLPVADALSELIQQNGLGAVQPDYVQRILAAFSKLESPDALRDDRPAPSPPSETEREALIEPLTDREMDVLRLMAQGLKYREIAAELFISLNTVRSHVKAIYGKLNVNNRTNAITTARQRQIL